MPVKTKEREYRALQMPLQVVEAQTTKRIQSENYIEGYATKFDSPYLLFEFSDGWKYYERIDKNALKEADMSDIIMQYDHSGRVFARKSNDTLIVEADEKGVFVCADLSKTEAAKELYQDIAAGMINKMSWAFRVKKDSITEDRENKTITRDILEIKKVYDVSAVSRPANEDTEISARNFAEWSYKQIQGEHLKMWAQRIRVKTMI